MNGNKYYKQRPLLSCKRVQKTLNHHRPLGYNFINNLCELYYRLNKTNQPILGCILFITPVVCQYNFTKNNYLRLVYQSPYLIKYMYSLKISFNSF